MKLQALKHFGITIAIVFGGIALGWASARVVPSTKAPLIEAGDFSQIIEKAHHPAVLFVTSTCPYCRKAREFLSGISADYFVYEIDTSPEAKRLYQTLGVDQVPVLITGNARITGFNVDIYRARTLSTNAPRE